MRLDNLVQYIVPLTFLAIWALTSLFNREAQPLPPRSGNGRGLGPGPGRPAPGSSEPATSPARTGNESMAGFNTGPPDRATPTRPPRSRDEGIVVIEADPRRPSAQAPARPASGGRRGARGRASAGAPGKRAEPPVPRALSAEMSRTHAPLVEHPEALERLASAPASSLLVLPDRGIPSIAETSHTRSKDSPTMTAAAVRDLSRSPERLREAFIAAEVLFRPPLALRRPVPIRRVEPPAQVPPGDPSRT
jgi:hypothetical protein